MLVASNAASPRNVFGFIKGCFWKKSIKTEEVLESARDLSSSGESDFFPQRYQDVLESPCCRK